MYLFGKTQTYTVYPCLTRYFRLTKNPHRIPMGLWGWKIIPIPMGIPFTATLAIYTVFICQQSYLILLGIPSPTNFHSRLKTFLFCKFFPPQPFLFLQISLYMDSPNCYRKTSIRSRVPVASRVPVRSRVYYRASKREPTESTSAAMPSTSSAPSIDMELEHRRRARGR